MNAQHSAHSTQHSLVACLRIPDFLVALARRDNPSLRRRAVVIGGSPEEHAQVTACSREAAEAGVTVGMTLRRALALCPKAVFLPLQEGLAAAEAARITDLLCLYSPAVEVIAPGHAHFDIRGLARMAGMDDEVYLCDLHEAVSSTCGLPVHLAAAETVFAAHAATMVDARFTIHNSRFDPIQNPKSKIPNPSVLLVPPGRTKDFLAVLPIEVLPVDPAMHQRLRIFGLERLGQVAALPFSAMQAQFGPPGARAWELANGHDDARIVPKRDELRVSEEIELPAPTALAEPLVVGTRALLQRALSRPEVRGQSLRRLDWRLGLESGEQVARRFVFREPTSDPARMLFVVKNKIERLQLEAAAVSLGLTLSGLCSEYGHQANLWPIGPRRQKELLEAIEQLNAREGEAQVYRIVEVQPWSRIPERQLALVAYQP
jgi:nucleotidyltransferase/DNA polymerase involved in DNA repair